ncbi:MAG: hypothetical protein KDE00_02145 [Rhodobacteraceae bacterium]|nr:hypothetical protein [Paracoccaceae bacterium]
MTVGTKRAMRAGAVLLAAVAALGGCGRKQFVLTECVDGRPVVERTLDVAPPNCEG